MTTTTDQDRALAELMASPDNVTAGCTLTDDGMLFVRVDFDREYLIDKDGTIIRAIRLGT